MPFGAEVEPGGVTRFRLWAPKAESVQLRVMSAGRNLEIPMDRLENGWYELIVKDVRAGALYRFKIDGRSAVPDPASRHQPGDGQ